MAIEAEAGFIHKGRADRPYIGSLAGIIRGVIVITRKRALPFRVDRRVGVSLGNRGCQAVLAVEVIVYAPEDARGGIGSWNQVVIVVVDSVADTLVRFLKILEKIFCHAIDP